MAKYRIRGLDCANCALTIEKALNREAGLENARVNFAAATVEFDGAYEAEARAVISSIEPGAAVSAADNEALPDPDAEADALGAGALVRIAVAGALFAVGTAFHDALHATPLSVAEYAVLLPAYVLIGFPVLRSAFTSILRGQVFNEMFLMSVATVGAIAIHQIPEAVGVMLFYSLGEYFQDRAVAKSRRNISTLMDLRPDSARLVVNGRRETVPPASVAVGSLIEILPGERIPLDGSVAEGESFIDTSSLTGESVPRRVVPGDPVLSGCVNDEGKIIVRTEKTFAQSAASRILELVEDAAGRKAPTERFISRFAAVYTPAVVIGAALIAFVPPLLVPGASLADWAYRALILLVISCPCALVISVPLGYFGGIGGAARHKILIKGANYLDSLARADTVVFDKTGTLTEGVFAVNETVTRNGFTEDGLLAWAAAAESHSSHPIARSIREAYRASRESNTLRSAESTAESVAEIKGHGVMARVEGRAVLVGNDRFLHREDIAHGDCDVPGTVTYIAVDGTYAGYLVISDRVKANAAATVADLKSLSVRRTVMLTGDDRGAAEKVAEETGIDGAYAELLPADKVERLEELLSAAPKGKTTVFVGDGMNDAPVLVRADVGIAMGGLGSDAAIEAADAVIMDDDISRVPHAIRIARFTRRVVVQNIVLAMAVKGAFIALGSFGVANMWEAVIADVGVALLAVLNSLRTVRVK